MKHSMRLSALVASSIFLSSLVPLPSSAGIGKLFDTFVDSIGPVITEVVEFGTLSIRKAEKRLGLLEFKDTESHSIFREEVKE